MATTRGTSATTRNRPITCGVCGLKLRGAANPLLEHGMPEHCGLPMDWTSAEDASRFLDGVALETHPAIVDEERAYDSRLAREAHARGLGLGRRKQQCGACRKFLPDGARGHCPHCSAINGSKDGDWLYG